MYISVIIPSFEPGQYLLEAVQSIIDQSGDFKILEILIIDDGSRDIATLKTYEILSKNHIVKLLENEGLRGSAGARNTGVRQAKGYWIAFLDADDWWPEDSLAKRFDALVQFPDAEWIGGDFVELNRDGTWESLGRFERNLDTYSFLTPAYQLERKPIQLKTPIKEFLHQAPTHTIVSLIKKSLFERIGGFKEQLLRQQDYHLFLRLAQASDFVFVPQIAAYYRLHEANSTKSLTHTQEWRIKALQDLSKLSEFSSFNEELKASIHSMHLSNSYIFRENSEFLNAALSASKAIISSPLADAGWRSLAASLIRHK